jgi:hypothetical protein
MHAVGILPGMGIDVHVLNGRLGRRVDAMTVVDPALVLVDEDLVGGVDFSELFFCDQLALRRRTVWVCLECPLLVGAADLVWTGIARQLEGLVEPGGHIGVGGQVACQQR